jgi:hypothetical protein
MTHHPARPGKVTMEVADFSGSCGRTVHFGLETLQHNATFLSTAAHDRKLAWFRELGIPAL